MAGGGSVLLGDGRRTPELLIGPQGLLKVVFGSGLQVFSAVISDVDRAYCSSGTK